LGMVIQFLSNTGDLKSDIIFFTLSHKRIDEGLAAVFRTETASRIRESNET
jgi:hypothetical protein